MANNFDFEHTLGLALQPLQTLAAGTLSNSRERAQAMFDLSRDQTRRRQQLEDAGRNREEHLQDVIRSETRLDKIRADDRKLLLEDEKRKQSQNEAEKRADRLYEFTVKVYQNTFDKEKALELVREQVKVADEASKRISERKFMDQGFEKKPGQSRDDFIADSASQHASALKTMASEFKANDKRILDMSSQSADIETKSKKELDARVKESALASFAASLGKDTSLITRLQGKNAVSPEKLIQDLAATDPTKAAQLADTYNIALNNAMQRLAPEVEKSTARKQKVISLEIAELQQSQARLRSSQYYDDMARFFPTVAQPVGAGVGLNGVTPPPPRGAPNADSMAQFAKSFTGEQAQAQPATSGAGLGPVSDQSGNQVEGLFPFLGRKSREVSASIPTSRLASEGVMDIGNQVVDMGQGLASVPGNMKSAMFGGSINTPTSSTGLPFLDIPAGIVKMGLSPLDWAGNSMSDVSDVMTGQDGYPASTQSDERQYRLSHGLKPAQPAPYDISKWSGNPVSGSLNMRPLPPQPQYQEYNILQNMRPSPLAPAKPNDMRPAPPQPKYPEYDILQNMRPSPLAPAKPNDMRPAPPQPKYPEYDILQNIRPQQQQPAVDPQRDGLSQFFLKIYGDVPSEQENREMQAFVLNKGYTMPQIKEIGIRAYQGDPQAINTMHQLRMMARESRAFAPK